MAALELFRKTKTPMDVFPVSIVAGAIGTCSSERERAVDAFPAPLDVRHNLLAYARCYGRNPAEDKFLTPEFGTFIANDFTRVFLNRVRSSIQQGWIGAMLLIFVFVLSRRNRLVVLFNFGKIDYSKRILTRFP